MFILPSPLLKLPIQQLTKQNIQLSIKRDDLIHPNLSGNKWRKLKYYFASGLTQPIVSFGGAYSNHLHALAYAGHYFKRPVHAIVRADGIDPSNETLNDCQALGMTIECVDRQTYRQKNNPTYLNELQAKHPNACIIAEGGFGADGMKGVAELVSELDCDFSHIICPVGSATTFTGIISQLNPRQQAIGIAALAKAEYLTADIQLGLTQLKSSNDNWILDCDQHLGGFGKITPSLLDFIEDFYQRYQILLDPIYTGKMMLALFNAIQAGQFKDGDHIIAVHTGGLQGWRGFAQRELVSQHYLAKLGIN